jgi:hypothetical protein
MQIDIDARISWSAVVCGGLLACALSATPAHAQLNTQHIKRGRGTQRRVTAAPGTYVIAPLFYIYDTDTVRQEQAIGFRSTRGLRALPRPGALTSSPRGSVLGATTVSSAVSRLIQKPVQGTEIDSKSRLGA